LGEKSREGVHQAYLDRLPGRGVPPFAGMAKTGVNSFILFISIQIQAHCTIMKENCQMYFQHYPWFLTDAQNRKPFHFIVYLLIPKKIVRFHFYLFSGVKRQMGGTK
jgi:hypothetical protein